MFATCENGGPDFSFTWLNVLLKHDLCMKIFKKQWYVKSKACLNLAELKVETRHMCRYAGQGVAHK